jgi:hypothetical protein
MDNISSKKLNSNRGKIVPQILLKFKIYRGNILLIAKNGLFYKMKSKFCGIRVPHRLFSSVNLVKVIPHFLDNYDLL